MKKICTLILAILCAVGHPAFCQKNFAVVKFQGQILKNAPQLVRPEEAYFIKNKKTQQVLSVWADSPKPGETIAQAALFGSIGQKFMFEKVGMSHFYIRTLTKGYYLTALATGSAANFGFPYKIIQDELYSATSGAKHPDAQMWALEKTDEEGCFLLSTKMAPNFVLVASGGLGIAQKDGSDLQKWVFKITTAEGNPLSEDAQKGLEVGCNATLSAKFLGLTLAEENVPLSRILPEWRSVNEDYMPSVSKPPLDAYRVLEGVVEKSDPAKINFEDMPIAHFTHDFNFYVKPDPPFKYLLGKHKGTVQDAMEVEWECGIAQNGHPQENPAAAPNRKGESFGFYSAGHKRHFVIWNWPTSNDWVHVEGQWIWDRGHDDPYRTEIHPPRLVAIKRFLPDKATIGNSGQFAFATRCDIYANGDGNIIWNNKGLHNFAQKVKMSDRDYVMVFRHDLPRPNANARLAFKWVTQPGDNFGTEPKVTLRENGTADVPEPHVEVSIPWQSKGISDKAVFGRTLFVYWNDLPKHGVPANFAIKKVRVQLEKVVVLHKREGGDLDEGDYRLFADIGGKWVFLNEFLPVDKILSQGLGDTWDSLTASIKDQLGQPKYPISKNEYIYPFDQIFEVYVPKGKEFRVFATGWEGDYMESHFGRLMNPFTSCSVAKSFVQGKFDGLDAESGGYFDDPIGDVNVVLTFIDLNFQGLINRGYSVDSEGKVFNAPRDRTDPNGSYRLYFSIHVETAN